MPFRQTLRSDAGESILGFGPIEPSLRGKAPPTIVDVLASAIQRRAAGEDLSDDQIISAHPGLMPDLSEKLDALRKVEIAQERASHGENPSAVSSRGAFPGSPGDRGRISECIAGCDVVEEIHRGGQGVVYRAVERSTGRVVAIKFMRDRPFLGPRDEARFEREIRVLALLKHPNIVAIHASGKAEGCHYFVMDYIDGHPLDEYLQGRSLSVGQLLQLFRYICDAVNAAHLRGVIHRDLKPSNICVDHQGVPHVLDFGLAKSIGENVGDTAVWRAMTVTGQFVGTLSWASPEQADGDTAAIDVRTDVYSLGVVFYYMLTGRFPYDVSGAMRDTLANIADAEPVKPRSIRREIDEDVEALVLKCLAKEPDRRYQSAGAIVEDIDRHDAHEPILARTPSTIYYLKKLVKRHKLPTALIVVLFVSISACAVWMSVLYGVASHERNRAEVAEVLAEQRRAEAQREAESASAINEFFVRDMLASANPDIAQGHDITVAEALDNTAASIDVRLADQPLVRASVHAAVGRSYLSLGFFEKAGIHLWQAERIRSEELDPDHPDAIRVRILYVEALRRLDRLSEAVELSELTLAVGRRVLGDDDVDTLRAAFERAVLLWRVGRIPEATELHEDTLNRRRRVLGASHPDTIASLNEKGIGVTLRGGRSEDAMELFQQALEDARRDLGEDHPTTLATMAQLGKVLANRRSFEEAEPLMVAAYEGNRRVLGDHHTQTLISARFLGSLYKEQDRLDLAEQTLRKALEASRGILGDEHPMTLDLMYILGNTLSRHRKRWEAAEILRRVHEISQRLYGDEHGRTAAALNGQYTALVKLGRCDGAIEAQRQALDVSHRLWGREHPETSWLLRCVVYAYVCEGRSEEARPFAEELLALRKLQAEGSEASAYRLNCYARDLLTVEPIDLRAPELALEVALQAFDKCTDTYHYNRYTVALAYEATGQLERAADMMRRALEHAPVESSDERSYYDSAMVRILKKLEDPVGAEQVYRNTLRKRREHFEEAHPDIAYSLEALGLILMRHGKSGEAEPLLRECRNIRDQALPQDHWRTAAAMSALGECLTELGELAEAKPLLRQGLDILEEDQAGPVSELALARQRWAVLLQRSDRVAVE